MKKIVFTLCAFFALSATTFAQRYAVIDSKYILDKLPEDKEAQQK